jgi:hypothetical protein
MVTGFIIQSDEVVGKQVKERLSDLKGIEIKEEAPYFRELFLTLLPYLDRLGHIARLEDGWCGPATEAPQACLANALWILTQLPPQTTRHLRPEDITPTPYGSIILEWERDSVEKLSLEIGVTAANYYYQRRNQPLTGQNGLALNNFSEWKQDIIQKVADLFA